MMGGIYKNSLLDAMNFEKSIYQQRQDILLQAVSLSDLHYPTSNRDNNVFKYKTRLRYFIHHKLFLTVAHPNKAA